MGRNVRSTGCPGALPARTAAGSSSEEPHGSLDPRRIRESPRSCGEMPLRFEAPFAEAPALLPATPPPGHAASATRREVPAPCTDATSPSQGTCGTASAARTRLCQRHEPKSKSSSPSSFPASSSQRGDTHTCEPLGAVPPAKEPLGLSPPSQGAEPQHPRPSRAAAGAQARRPRVAPAFSGRREERLGRMGVTQHCGPSGSHTGAKAAPAQPRRLSRSRPALVLPAPTQSPSLSCSRPRR